MEKSPPREKLSPSALSYIFSKTVLKNLAVTLIVGCALSAANQMDALLAGNLTPALYVKIAFNFLVPFTVASISAALNRRNSNLPGERQRELDVHP